jgi:Na+/proline symporter
MSLIGLFGVITLVSFLISPRVRTVQGFYRGYSEDGVAPGLLTLVFSQVTTWIFARSLLNAGILGYYYGIAGALAYAAYYLSFLTGAWIVDGIRFKHGCDSIQRFLVARFGRLGSGCYNVVAGIRLLSEVFANLLVIGIIFGVAGSTGYILSIVAVAVLTLGYSMLGGLRASLRTDVFQMSVLLVVLAVLFGQSLLLDGFGWGSVLASSPDFASPGWVLLAVALLQIWSYPMHDPVMMDRGFVADRETTRRSFIHACWLSAICILIFGLLGVEAGLLRHDGEDLVKTLTRLLSEPMMMFFNIALILSAVSTLDSTFSSASKLAVVDMRLAEPTPRNGRIAMVAFLIGGLAFLFLGSKDLFSAVAVSGTASMFLAPVAFFSIWGGREVARWSFAVAFAAAIAGAALYMVESGGYLSIIEPLTGIAHKYTKLLVISAAVLAIGCGAFALGLKREGQGASS